MLYWVRNFKVLKKTKEKAPVLLFGMMEAKKKALLLIDDGSSKLNKSVGICPCNCPALPSPTFLSGNRHSLTRPRKGQVGEFVVITSSLAPYGRG